MCCSESCKTQHYSMCHKILCGESMPYTWVEPSLRFMMTGIQELGSFKELYKLVKNPTKKTVFDFDDITSKNFVSVVCSMRTSKKRKDYLYGKPAFLEKVGKIPFQKLLSSPENVNDVKDCFIRILANYNTNSSTLDSGDIWNVENFGSSVGLISSLFKHGCDPNIGRTTLDNKTVFSVIRPIKAGDELLMSSGPEFLNFDLHERQAILREFDINCDCAACKKNYPLLEDLPKLNKGNVKRPSKEYNVNELIKYFKKNCESIEKYQKYHPCYETTEMISNNLQAINLIAEFKL